MNKRQRKKREKAQRRWRRHTDRLTAEAQAVIGTDPRKVRAVTDIDVAERKAELIAAQAANGAAKG